MGERKRKGPANPAAPDWRDKLFPVLLPLLLFLAMSAISGLFAVGFTAVFLVFALGRRPIALAEERMCPMTWAVLLYAGVCLCSSLWSHFGSYAREEAVKTLVALCVFGLVLTRVKGGEVRRLLWTLNGILAAVGLLCIDGSSLKVLTRVFSWVMGLLWSLYELNTVGYETGVRITGIYSNANVSAGVLAFGLILSLYLFQTERDKKKQLAAGVLLGVEALAFFLSFSMGAMGAFALTCLVYLLCAGKGKRLSLFLLMVESVLATLLCAFAAYPFLGKTGGAALIPMALAPLCGLLIWALDRFVGARVEAALEGKTRAVGIAAGALALLMAGYALLAMNLTGGTALAPGAALSRAVALSEGEYHVEEMSWDGSISVQVYSQNDQDLMMHTRTVLYEGDLSQAAFTVPGDSRVVWFAMSGEGEINRLVLSDGTKVPLGYRLLPGFAANRLQALWANQNLIQRLVFFRDGIQLWLQSPLIGWGAGGVEGQLTAVQSFYYESKYIHNQFIQILDEAGIVGLASFLFLLGSAVWMLVRHRKEERDPLFAMLAASLTMMVSHSMTEVVWSTQFYQVVAFTLFGVLVIRFHQPGGGRRALPAARLTAWALCLVTAVFALLQGGSQLAAYQFRGMKDQNLTQEQFVSKLGVLDTLDVYDDTIYKTNRMANALQTGQTGIANRCARQLMEREEFTACYYAAAYYYLPMGQLPGFFQATRTGLVQEASNAQAWNSVFNLYRQTFEQLSAEEMDDYTAGVAGTGAVLAQLNGNRMEEIVLSQENQALLDCVKQIAAQGLSGQGAYEALAACLEG